MERSLARPFALVLCVSAATVLLVGAYLESLELARPAHGLPPGSPELPCNGPGAGTRPDLPQCPEAWPELRTAEVAEPPGALPRRRG